MTSLLRSVQSMAVALFFLANLAASPVPAQDAKQLAGACVACHPKSAVPANSVNPIIWGQNAGYLYVQLRDFKSSARASESDAVMHAMTQMMTDVQMLAIAEYVSTQPWPKAPVAPPTDPLARRGALLLAYGDCGTCHFNDWRGYSVNPRLRGQTPAYLRTTIEEFRNGSRGNSPGMSDLLKVYSAEDIGAIVVYLSSLD
jgi:cytochrome c553